MRSCLVSGLVYGFKYGDEIRGIDIDWEHDIPEFLECVTEYAYGAVKGKKNRVGYINFLLKITPDCDCVPWSDAPIVPDIGILASSGICFGQPDRSVACRSRTWRGVRRQLGIGAGLRRL